MGVPELLACVYPAGHGLAAKQEVVVRIFTEQNLLKHVSLDSTVVKAPLTLAQSLRFLDTES